MNTPPRPCQVAAPPVGGVMIATPPPPCHVVEHTESASGQSESEPDVNDVVTLLNWALTACRHTVKVRRISLALEFPATVDTPFTNSIVYVVLSFRLTQN